MRVRYWNICLEFLQREYVLFCFLSLPSGVRGLRMFMCSNKAMRYELTSSY